MASFNGRRWNRAGFSLPVVLGLIGLSACVSTQPAVGPAEVVPTAAALAPALGYLHTEGKNIVDENGRVVPLRGVNIGGWLLIEPWMIGIENEKILKSEKEFWDIMAERFGNEAKLDLIQTYRETYFTEDDVRKIAETGVNCIRVPIWWRALSDPAYGGDMTYLDRCVEWCAKYGLYVIIDLHGAPGTQATQSVIAGEPADGALWKKAEYKDQLVEWWKQIAMRYKDQPAVAGYDLLNEAFSAPFDDMMKLYDRLYREIRSIDPKRMLFLEDGLIGFHRMPLPQDMGWENVVYSFHYYPQDRKEGLEAAASHLHKFNRSALYYGVPTYVGEFNSIQGDRGGASIFLRYCEVFDYFGWSWTFWTYKKAEENKDNNWGLYGYCSTKPAIDPRSDSLESIKQSLLQLATENTRENLLMKAALMTKPRWVPEAEQANFGPGAILLTMAEAYLLPGEKGDIRMEWGFDRPNAGYWKAGDRICWNVRIPHEGLYELGIRMANSRNMNSVGVWIDGIFVTAAPVQNTGDWQIYRDQSLCPVRLTEGRHTIEITEADDEYSFLNLRFGWLKPAPAEGIEAIAYDEKTLMLTPFNIQLRPGSPVRVEWMNDPPNAGFWLPGEKVTWKMALKKGGRYTVKVQYATPDKDTTMKILVNNQMLVAKALESTGSWQAFKTFELGEMDVPATNNEIVVIWDAAHKGSTGNFRGISLDRKEAANP